MQHNLSIEFMSLVHSHLSSILKILTILYEDHIVGLSENK